MLMATKVDAIVIVVIVATIVVIAKSTLVMVIWFIAAKVYGFISHRSSSH